MEIIKLVKPKRYFYRRIIINSSKVKIKRKYKKNKRFLRKIKIIKYSRVYTKINKKQILRLKKNLKNKHLIRKVKKDRVTVRVNGVKKMQKILQNLLLIKNKKSYFEFRIKFNTGLKELLSTLTKEIYHGRKLSYKKLSQLKISRKNLYFKRK